jgi:hypothetical protein
MVTDRVHMARLQSERERVQRGWVTAETTDVMPWNVWESERIDETENAPHVGYLAGTGQWVGPSWHQAQATKTADGSRRPVPNANDLRDLWGAWQEDKLELNDNEEKDEEEYQDELTSGRAAPQEMERTISQSGTVLRIGTPLEMAITRLQRIPPKRVRKHRWQGGGQRLGSKDPMEMEGVMRRGFLLGQGKNKSSATSRLLVKSLDASQLQKRDLVKTTTMKMTAPEDVEELIRDDDFFDMFQNDTDLDDALMDKVNFEEMWDRAENGSNKHKLASNMRVLHAEEDANFFDEGLGIGMEIVGSDVPTGSSEVDVLKVGLYVFSFFVFDFFPWHTRV